MNNRHQDRSNHRQRPQQQPPNYSTQQPANNDFLHSQRSLPSTVLTPANATPRNPNGESSIVGFAQAPRSQHLTGTHIQHPVIQNSAHDTEFLNQINTVVQYFRTSSTELFRPGFENGVKNLFTQAKMEFEQDPLIYNTHYKQLISELAGYMQTNFGMKTRDYQDII
jgi:hypothetical protein